MPLKLVLTSRSPNWWLRGSVRGISVRETTGTPNREEAEMVLIIRSKEVLEESLFGKRANVTFDQAAESYLEAGGSSRFLDRVRMYFGNKPLRNLRQNDLDVAALTLFPRTTPATRNRQCYTPFIAVWNHAVLNDWADLRLWRRPRKQKGTTVRTPTSRSGTKPVDYERASLFVAQMAPAPAMAMTALFFTGMRPIELFTLERDDVFVSRRWIVVSNSKSGEPRGVPMHEFLVPLFESMLNRKDRHKQVFRTFRGVPYVISGVSGGQLSNGIVTARKRLADTGLVLDDISPYTARHSVSTQLVINGVHPYMKDQILGHAVDSMSRRYTNVPQAHLIQAINTIAVPDSWRNLWWWRDPLACSRNHIKWGTVRH